MVLLHAWRRIAHFPPHPLLEAAVRALDPEATVGSGLPQARPALFLVTRAIRSRRRAPPRAASGSFSPCRYVALHALRSLPHTDGSDNAPLY